MSQNKIESEKKNILRVKFYIKILSASLYRLENQSIKVFVKFDLDKFKSNDEIELSEWDNITELTSNRDFTGKHIKNYTY
jgi:hypothetical protein